MKVMFLILVVFLSIPFAKLPILKIVAVDHDSVVVADADTIWLDKNKFIVYRVVVDTVTRVIDTIYERSSTVERIRGMNVDTLSVRKYPICW